MAECPGCGSVVQRVGTYCASCAERSDAGVPPSAAIESEEPNEANLSGGSSAPLGATKWSGAVLTVLVAQFVLMLVLGQFETQATDLFLLGSIVSLSLVQGYSTYRDTRYVRTRSGWPRFKGAHYVLGSFVPILNWLVGFWYLLNRWELQYYDSTILTRRRARSVLGRPRRTLRVAYAGGGVLLASFIVLFFYVAYPFAAVFEDSAITGTFGLIALFGPLVVLGLHRYSRPERKKLYDYVLRDLSVRLLPVLGTAVIGIASLLVLMLPVTIVALLFTFPLGDEVTSAVQLGVLYPLLLVPLAIAFVLPLRALPWLQAAPHAFREAMEKLGGRFGAALPADPSTESRPGETPFLPVSGHDHTNLELNVSTSVAMNGIYGYMPRSIQEIDPGKLPNSLRRGLLYLTPGYLYACVVFTYFQLRPERAAEYASVFPAEDFLVASLSYVGIPRTVLVETIETAGLPPETISLGFLGLVIPALLMIPGAWHLTLEYEGYLYRLHQRLGDGNHLLFLWAIHILLVAPLVLGYTWYSDRKSRSD